MVFLPRCFGQSPKLKVDDIRSPLITTKMGQLILALCTPTLSENTNPVELATTYTPAPKLITGIWALSQCVRDYGYTWKAVGCYHSRTPEKRDAYAARIAAILRQRGTP